MQSRLILNVDDLMALVRAVLDYNRREPTDIVFLDSSTGAQVDVACHVTCEEAGLRIRVAPEDKHSPEEIAAFFSRMDPLRPIPLSDALELRNNGNH